MRIRVGEVDDQSDDGLAALGIRVELQPGADLKAVRRSYRKLLLQYHPDKFATQPEKQKVATEVTRRLTEAYNGLTRYLGG